MRKNMKYNRHSSREVFLFHLSNGKYLVLVDEPFISRRFITSIPRTHTISLNFLSIGSQQAKNKRISEKIDGKSTREFIKYEKT